VTELRSFFHKVYFIINTFYPTFRETLHAGRVKPFADASELSALCGRARLSQNGALGLHPSGSQTD